MSTTARAFFGFTALLVLVTLIVQIPLTADNGDEFFTSGPARVANLFFYFTILSGLLVGAVSAALAAEPDRRGRVFGALRLAAVVCITVTGVIYWLLLSADNPTEGLRKVMDYSWHLVIPLLGLSGWLVFGPRGRIDGRTAAWSLAVPAAWLAAALVRGAIIDWYPYPFIDVAAEGYLTVAINCAGIATVFALLAVAAMWIDRRLPDPSGGAAQ